MAVDPKHTANSNDGAGAGAGARPLIPIAPAPNLLYMRAQSSPGNLVYPSPRPTYPSPHNFHPQPPPQAYQSPPVRFPGLVAPPSSVPHSNGIREIDSDETQFVIQDRKVRITDGPSLYVLCRSWLRNGTSEETQPRYGDATRSLPRPSPRPMASATPPKKEEEDKKEDKDEESVEDVSPEDLLKRHIKNARKVRARLREERLRRIARYKARLALLLPPLVEQFRNDLAAGN